MNLFDLCVYKNLNKGSGGDVDVSSLVATENKTYNAGEGKAYNPVIVAIPEPTLISKNITANGDYSASTDNADGYSSVSVNVPLPSNAYLLQSIEHEQVATFSDGTDNFVKSLEVAIEPVQSGSGDPSPENIRPISGWTACNVTRSGKNLAYSQTNNTVVAHAKKGVTYTLSFDGTNRGANIKKNTSTGDKVATGANPLTFTADEDFDIFLNAWNSEFTNLQVEVGSSATTYETYNGTTITIDLDGTRYGGKLDVVSGVLTVDRAYVDLGTLNWQTQGNPNTFQAVISDMLTPSNNIMCSHYPTTPASTSAGNMPDKSIKTYGNSSAKYIIVKDSRYSDVATFKTAMSGVQLVYELTTPITIQLTPTIVKSLQGDNNFFASTGEIEMLQYWGEVS